MLDKVNILGLNFSHITQKDTINLLHQNIKSEKKTFIVTANPEIVMYASQNSDYMDTLQSADYIIADGIGVILGAKILKTPLPERIPGYDLMKELLEIADRERRNVFFLGSREDVIEKTIKNVRKDYPNLIIGGFHHGYFNKNDHKVVEMVENANSDLIFVALGYPKQEEWIQDNLHRFKKGIFMGVGGSFEVIAGTMKRAPKLMAKAKFRVAA